MSKGEARPFLRKYDKEAIRKDAREAKRQPLSADSQRALGQMSITDGVPIIRNAPPERPSLTDVIRTSQGLDETDPQSAIRPGTPDEWREEERLWIEAGQLPDWLDESNPALTSVLEHRSMQ